MEALALTRGKHLSWILAFGMAGCLSGPDDRRPSNLPADDRSRPPLSLKMAKGLAKPASEPGTAPAGMDFHLDTAAGSLFQYFFLQNHSGKTIHDIRIRTSSRQLQFLPAHMGSLAPAESLSFVQILKLAVIHGTRLNALGYDSVLPAGLTRAEGTIEGKLPGENGDTTRLTLPFGLSVFAKLVDVEVLAGGVALDLTRPDIQVSSAVSEDKYRGYYLAEDSVTLKNTGNVALLVKSLDEADRTMTVWKEDSLPAGGSLVLPTGTHLQLDGGGVTSDLNKLPASRSGKYHMALMRRW